MTKGFTLAEVLITLGIIGVVAAMTMPSLIQHYREKELITSYKRVYSILNQTYLLLKDEYGNYEDWEQNDEDTYNKFKKYLKISADCPPGKSNSACIQTDINYKDFAGNNIEKMIFNNAYSQPAIRLISGESILFYSQGHSINFIVDLNGNTKPNQLGIDLQFFSFNIGKNYMEILPGPTWSNNTTNQQGAQICQKDAEWFAGANCGYWILRHDNMNYLHMSDEEIIENW